MGILPSTEVHTRGTTGIQSTTTSESGVTPDTSDLVQSIGCVNRGETGADQRQLAQVCIN